MNSQQIVDIVIEALEGLKAEEIKVLDVSQVSNFTDIMIVASGRSHRQVRMLAEKIIENARQHKIKLLGAEGLEHGEWALVDLGDVIIHIMRPSTREIYQLEKLWQLEDRKPSAIEELDE